MIKSMTGYGRGHAQIDGLSFSVEIKAVNHRYGDVNIKSPRLLSPLETEIKKQVLAVLKRGKIDVFISQEHADQLAINPVVDKQVASAYMEAFKSLKEYSGLAGDISLEFLAAQKDVLVLKDLEFDQDTLWSCLSQALQSALTAIQETRQKEGLATQVDMEERLSLLAESIVAIEKIAALVPVEWQKKLQERLARLEENSGDPQRVAQEIAIFADRCDISEEITRFNSHLSQFHDLLKQQDPVGRQLDFLVQELNRETNTMGSKSNDANLTRHVVAVKAELEKIREQVQNIE
ncbi:TIGR00255 family protein [Desulfuromusa kysingii]|uniref:TIGR00255 family protein n=1 Tax=Desulfuromusa kysingii TaxID=37625 RepID=A0A1H4CYM6_9BACT|nr:YicC/YloC family endoribonuclease [Desulfuromusa kysingii]SEA65430.1 TIGR00255 family protein [Desulfuromusa kysingii]